ncbi:LysR family transcriptional regulator, partial [Streptomyces sp. SHP22-7]
VTAHLIAHGLGVALIPRLARLTPHLPIVRVPCAGRPHRKLLTCTRSGGHRRPAVAVALEELRSLAAAAVA